MFKNMGKKIKTLAKVLCWINISIGIIAMIVSVVFIIGSKTPFPLYAIYLVLLATALWVLIAWIGSFMLCGYGELIENTAEAAKNTRLLLDSTINNSTQNQ